MNGRIVGITSTLPLFGRGLSNKYRRGHRTVVLPDYQGIGIGNKMVEMMAEYYKDIGIIYRGTTSSRALIKYRLKHPEKWKIISKAKLNKRSKLIKGAINRLTMTFEYVG